MIRLTIPMKPCAKARPRITANGTYMPPAYRAWRGQFKVMAMLQLAKIKELPITKPFVIGVTYHTPSGNMRPDVDNALGAVLDALQPDVIANDGLCRRAYVGIERAQKERGKPREYSIVVTLEDFDAWLMREGKWDTPLGGYQDGGAA